MLRHNTRIMRTFIKEILSEVLRKFNVSEFRRYTDLKDMILYARYSLPLIGQGSSRIAFAYGSNKILKIALNEKGLTQNEAENTIFDNPQARPAMSRIFDKDGQGYWLISEIGRPLGSEDEFTSLMKFDWQVYKKIIKDFAKSGGGTGDIKSVTTPLSERLTQELEEIRSTPKSDPTDIKCLQDRLQDVTNIEKSPFVNAIIAAIRDNKLMPGDLAVVDHYGKTADGRVILLDAGFTEDVWKQHYEATTTDSIDIATKKEVPSGTVKPEELPTTRPARKQ